MSSMWTFTSREAQRSIDAAMGVSPWQCRWPTSSVSRSPACADPARSSSQPAIESMSMPGSGSKAIGHLLRPGIVEDLAEGPRPAGPWPRPARRPAEHARPERNAIAPQLRGAVDGVAVEVDAPAPARRVVADQRRLVLVAGDPAGTAPRSRSPTASPAAPAAAAVARAAGG